MERAIFSGLPKRLVPKIPNASFPYIIPKPTTQKPKAPTVKSTKIFIVTLTAFFVLTKPDSSKLNPPSINRTIAAANTIHTVFKYISSIVVSPSHLLNHQYYRLLFQFECCMLLKSDKHKFYCLHLLQFGSNQPFY